MFDFYKKISYKGNKSKYINLFKNLLLLILIVIVFNLIHNMGL